MQTFLWTKQNSYSNIAYHIKIIILVGSPSVSTENLSRLSRAPSLPRNRGRSGIPVAHHREFPTRGGSKRKLINGFMYYHSILYVLFHQIFCRLIRFTFYVLIL